jgi:hypothetical protein
MAMDPSNPDRSARPRARRSAARLLATAAVASVLATGLALGTTATATRLLLPRGEAAARGVRVEGQVVPVGA